MNYILIILISILGYSLNAQAPNGYKLFWEDNFEGQSLDLNKWKYRNLGKRRDAFNVEAMATVQKGYLALRTEQKNDTIFSSIISTQGKFETTYGYFEVRCLLQNEEGHWSAFWLQSNILGKYIGDVAKSGAEIDIYEFLPLHKNEIHHTIHYDGYGKDHKSEHKKVKMRKFDSYQFHTFGLEWTSESYTYYIDGKPTVTFKKGISQRDQYIILSLEVGDWAGNINNAKLPDYLIVDYVKVYKKE
ncbi:MAG: glycoside hydrolase family 16 protein [Chitinophagales bacterium]